MQLTAKQDREYAKVTGFISPGACQNPLHAASSSSLPSGNEFLFDAVETEEVEQHFRKKKKQGYDPHFSIVFIDFRDRINPHEPAAFYHASSAKTQNLSRAGLYIQHQVMRI